MKKLRREIKILMILMVISISLIILSIINGILFDWGSFWAMFLFLFYQIIPLFIAFYKTDKEFREFKENRKDFKTFIAKRLSVFKSLEILSISYSLFFGLFVTIYFRILLAGYEAQAIFFSAISLGLFGINFLISTYALVKYHYLTSEFFYPKENLKKFNLTEDITEDLLGYLNQLQIPYLLKEYIKYNLYLHFLTLLPFIFAIRF